MILKISVQPYFIVDFSGPALKSGVAILFER